MLTHPSPDHRGTRTRTEVRALVAALLLYGGILMFISACGNNDLIFPGDVPATPTSQFTATPTP